MGHHLFAGYSHRYGIQCPQIPRVSTCKYNSYNRTFRETICLASERSHSGGKEKGTEAVEKLASIKPLSRQGLIIHHLIDLEEFDE